MRDGDRRLLAGVAGFVAAVAAVNGFGYLVQGGSPGSDSAQGPAGFYFVVSLMASPVGAALGVAAGERLRRLRRREDRPDGRNR